jgi:RNA recognition motif-containing protein
VSKKLYVGNLSFNSTEDEIKTLFAQFGEVTNVTIIKDRDTARSRGFGFVEMEGADAAVTQLNGKEFGGRTLTVNEAREREDRKRGGGGGGGGDRGQSW